MLNLPEIKHIVAIASGKGGVGKSTVAANLALALLQKNYRVGLLDADIYGPSQPTMLGINDQKPSQNDDKKLIPIMCYGLQTMSMGYLIATDTPMIWRGPIASTALQQLIRDTAWQALDYLIIDLPPGTGDIQLTLAQKIPLAGVVIVTTPQEIALVDVRKAAAMFRKVHVPLLGIIENMSAHVCRHCGHQEAIFGKGGAMQFSQQNNIALLGCIALDGQICAAMDNGAPPVIAAPESLIAQQYRQIASHLIAKVKQQQRRKITNISTTD